MTKSERLKFIALKTDDGRITGKISFYCRAFHVTRQAFYDYLERKSKAWKYKPLVEEMMKTHNEDMCNDTYGRRRMYIALQLKREAGEISVHIPSEHPRSRNKLPIMSKMFKIRNIS